MEMHRAIVRMEQDGSDDGVLQVCLHKFGLVQTFENLFKFIFNCKF